MATTSDADGNSLTECEFDRGSLTMTCVHRGITSYFEGTVWDSIVAAVNDNRPLGRATLTSKKFDVGTCSISDRYIYDEAGRLTEISASTTDATSCGAYNVIYDTWDAEKRPKHGIGDGVGVARCLGVDMAYAYDETTRTISYVSSGGTGDDCQSYTSSATFDADGLLVSSTSFSDRSTHATEERGEICVD